MDEFNTRSYGSGFFGSYRRDLNSPLANTYLLRLRFRFDKKAAPAFGRSFSVSWD
jgi:hypothetical protein